MKIIICDDDNTARGNLLQLCNKHLMGDGAVIEDFSSAKQLTREIMQDVDIAFLDIEMPEINGLVVANKLHELCPKCLIIFVTSYTEYITEAMRNYAYQFLTKPVKEQDLVIELNRAKEELSRRISKLTIVCGEAERVFEVGKILYVESDNKHLRIVLVSGEVCVTRAKINKYYDFLLERNFAQPHKSYMVNLYYVKEFNNQCVTFDNGVAIPISRSKSADFKRAFNRYLNGVHYGK